jgi:hypothetical protein
VKLLRRPRADIGCHVGLGADEPAQVHELLKAELVALHRVEAARHAALPEVVRARPGACADAVAPVVAVGEAASWPAQVRRADATHVVHELRADAADVGNRRVATDPDAVVDDAAEVLDEVAVEVGTDLRPRLRWIHRDERIGGLERANACKQGDPGRGHGLEELTPPPRHPTHSMTGSASAQICTCRLFAT